MKHARELWFILLALTGIKTVAIAPASAQQLEGQVLGAGAPIANATVTLWAAGADAPVQLSRTESGTDGRFTLRFDRAPSSDSNLYLVATGGEPTANKGSGNNPAIALIAAVGPTPPAKVTINEMTTLASVWTHAAVGCKGARLAQPSTLMTMLGLRPTAAIRSRCSTRTASR